ncbi:MAG: GNAT family N-acetyltransferase [Rhodospirillaceae bacterium]
MTVTTSPIVRARAVAPGRLVQVRSGDLPEPPPGLSPDAEIIGMKTIRHGKGFISHYLVPLDGQLGAPQDLMLIGVDTDTPMRPADLRLDLIAVDGTTAECGHVLENAAGRFLKVREAYKDAFSLAYVEITAGDIRRRQDRGITAVYAWAVVGVGDAPKATPAPAPKREVPVAVRETKAAVQAIRAMTLRDVEGAAELLAARDLPVGKDGERRLAEALTSPLSLCLVAEVDDAIAGAAVAHYDGFHVHLSMIAVDARLDRHGIGRALVEALAEAGLARGALGLLADAGLGSVPFLAATGFRLNDGLRLRRDV